MPQISRFSTDETCTDHQQYRLGWTGLKRLVSVTRRWREGSCFPRIAAISASVLADFCRTAAYRRRLRPLTPFPFTMRR